MTNAPTADELAEKRSRVLDLLDHLDLDAVVLRRPGNVAWYSGGGRTHILATPDEGVAALVVHRDGAEVVTAINEAPRLQAEELGALEAEWRVLPWSTDLAEALPHGPRIGTDAGPGDSQDVRLEIEEARRALTSDEQDRSRALGRDAAAALTRACRALRPEQSEFDAAAAVASALIEVESDPVVLLVAGEERLPHHRHALPTDRPLGRLAMLVACARRGGLIVSLTRFVAFHGLTDAERDAYARLLRVDVAYNQATTPGRTVGDACAAGMAAYGAAGFDAEEWRLHHQGGPTGYEGRDYLATPEAQAAIVAGQAFAWNPSVPSLKSEDTILAQPDGPEVLSVDPEWPTTVVDGLARPLVLEP